MADVAELVEEDPRPSARVALFLRHRRPDELTDAPEENAIQDLEGVLQLRGPPEYEHAAARQPLLDIEGFAAEQSDGVVPERRNDFQHVDMRAQLGEHVEERRVGWFEHFEERLRLVRRFQDGCEAGLA